MTNPYNYQLLRQKIDESNKNRIRIRDIVRHTGFSETYVHKILTGEKFGENGVFKIADYLGVPREALVKTNGKRKAK